MLFTRDLAIEVEFVLLCDVKYFAQSFQIYETNSHSATSAEGQIAG